MFGQSGLYDIIKGHAILAKALAIHKIEYSFGIVGVPVIELGFSLQGEGIKYYGFRNEQQASYAAGVIGYLTQKPGVCLCVSGPGHTNAISGIANAWSNCWPMILLSGASELGQTSFQAFQECDQETLVKPFCKYSVRITNASSIPFHVEKAIRMSITGRPGPVYIQLPGDVLKEVVGESEIDWRKTPIQIPLYLAPDNYFEEAVVVLKSAQRPLVIVGKGAAYGNASRQVIQLINSANLPFLPTPMGKGVVPDSHPKNISAARSTAISKADVIILIGGRLNWILHYGLPKRFDPKVKFIQIDICPQQMSHNVPSVTHLVGDCRLSVQKLNESIKKSRWKFSESSEWHKVLSKKVKENVQVSNKLMNTKATQLTYYTSGKIIRDNLPKDYILVNQGANTMDIGRTIYTHESPLRRLDAGTFGTMGVGLPFVVAAKAFTPKSWVVAVMGDSAFGFSAMEVETLTRYQLGGVIFIINNNGIYSGVDKLEGDPEFYSVTSLNPEAKYEMLADAFGGKGYKVVNEKQLQQVCKEIFKDCNINKLFIVNVAIDTNESKKPQENAWLTTPELKPKI